MSKIFEALQRVPTGETTQVLAKAFEGQPPQTEAAGAEAPRVEPPPVESAAPSAAAKPRLAPLPAPRVADPYGPLTAAVRTVPITVTVSSPLFPFDQGQNYSAEQYKIIRTKILQHPGRPQMILISSAGPADGKSVTAINLAASLSLKEPTSVLLIDGDFRRSTVHVKLGLPPAPGISDVLSGDCAAEDAIVRAEQFPNLYILPVGTQRPNVVELLDSKRWADFCDRVREQFEYIVIDSTPVAAVADYHLLQASCDGIVMVLRPDHTHRKLCLEAFEIIPREKFLGIILNYVREWFLTGRYKQDYYSFYYSRSNNAGAQA